MYEIYFNNKNNVCIVNNLLFAAGDKAAEVFFFKFVCCENCALAYEKNFQTFSCKNLQVFFCKRKGLESSKNLSNLLSYHKSKLLLTLDGGVSGFGGSNIGYICKLV